MPNIDEIRARCEAATPGPWTHEYCPYPDEQSYRVGNCEYVLGFRIWKENAEFIAHAREDIPALLDHIDALEARLAKEEREKDAAIKRLSELGDCETCIHDGEFSGYSDKPGYRCNTPICGHSGEKGNWQWRGAPERTEG